MRILPTQTLRSSERVKNFQEISNLISDMIALCHQPLGNFPSAIALAHCQVEHRHPKRFFVMHDGEVIMNPQILDRSDPVSHLEGCMSYPFRGSRKVPRYAKMTVQYQNAQDEMMEEQVEGLRAFVFQHEIDHMNGKAIYS